MKTSKIILIVFFSILALFMLSLRIQVDTEKQNQQNVEKSTTNLPTFNHLVIKNSTNIRLKQGKEFTAFVNFKADSQIQMPTFEIKSDTLVLNWPKNENNWNKTITCPNLKSIRIENSMINIDNLPTDSLRVYAMKGEIFYNTSSNLNYLQLSLSQNSIFRINGQRIKNIEADITQSKAEIWLNQTDTLRASLRKQSNLSTNQVLKTEVETDASRRYYSR